MWPVLLLLLVETIRADCHPVCSYECNNPQCFADCSPVCKPPLCQACNNVSGSLVGCTTVAAGVCSISCPEDQCENDGCPACETQCDSSRACRWLGYAQCVLQCAETQCAWQCERPNNCPTPFCELYCDPPACQNSSALRAASLLALLFVLLQ